MDRESFDRLWDSVSEQADPAIENPRYKEGRYIQQDEKEMWELVCKLNELKPQRILEIGNACGGTTLFWQAIAPIVVSIDLYPVGSEPGEGFPNGIISLDMFSNVRFILGDSHLPEILELAKKYAPYDFLFIDGDHEIPGVISDWEMYSPLVREGGLIAFHDWTNHVVGEAIRRIGTPDETIVYKPGFGMALFHKK